MAKSKSQSEEQKMPVQRFGSSSVWGEKPKPKPSEQPVKSFKTGGTVKKTGTYRLHKGERVIPVKKKGR